MGWTFKTPDNTPIIITPEQSEHNPDTGHYYDPDIVKIDIGEKWCLNQVDDYLCERISVQEYNKLKGIRVNDFLLSGNGWTGKDISMRERQEKALRKNPMHTTMSDYKFENPDSITTKARKKNLKRMQKRKIKVKKNETKNPT